MSNEKPDSKWIRDQLETLTEHTAELRDIGVGADNDYGPMTALKLSILTAAVEWPATQTASGVQRRPVQHTERALMTLPATWPGTSFRPSR